MRLFLSLVLFSCFGFSQSNNAQINQALNTAKANNINSKSDVENALRQNGISESQARALARQKGVSYEEILNSNFTDSAVISEDSPKDPNVSWFAQTKGSYKFSLLQFSRLFFALESRKLRSF
jgi:hypothetical protein